MLCYVKLCFTVIYVSYMPTYMGLCENLFASYIFSIRPMTHIYVLRRIIRIAPHSAAAFHKVVWCSESFSDFFVAN